MKTTNFNFRIDEKVILTMVAISVIALAAMAFRYKNHTPCTSFDFKISSNDFRTGQLVFFSAITTQHASRWEWDFGDKSPHDTKSGPIASHIYTQPGQYLITLKINDKCTEFKSINIERTQRDSIARVAPQVNWPQEPIATGQQVWFRDLTNGASRWEWFIGEGKESQQFVTREVPYTFTTPGKIPVRVVINGNVTDTRTLLVTGSAKPVRSGNASNDIGYSNRQPVRIKDQPDNVELNNQGKQPEKATPKIEIIPLPDFEDMFRQAVTGGTSAHDFKPYLCGKDVAISYNGDPVSLEESIKRLRSIKKLKRVKDLKANIITYQGTSCIMSINLVVDKKWSLFGGNK
jgi:PKD domain